ncbi:hypothetical protein MNV49_007757 [Pseudohyphozyma bogoriensis]|nr:hypothetical protein MNV49_007757 [Pseudohyphozyma bogoriensis]
MYRLALRQLPLRSSRCLLRPCTSRSLRTSASLLNATPDWQELIGGREVVERKKKAFEDKYKDVLEEKARREGVSVDELKERAKPKVKVNERVEVPKAKVVEEVTGEAGQGKEKKEANAKAQAAAAASGGCGGSKDPIKPLGSILDLSKVATLNTQTVSALWTTYHQSKSYLSATIPTETYNRMSAVAKKYPMFVLPLAREPPAGSPEGENGAVEMHLLQWAFLPPPSTVLEPVPSPSTVLFTPLAEYQARQAYAQPYLILTHYTDLSLSHNVVLMRGEITENVALNAVDAQVLGLRLQQFYNQSGALEGKDKERKELLETFHERPQEFDLERLIKIAWEID